MDCHDQETYHHQKPHRSQEALIFLYVRTLVGALRVGFWFSFEHFVWIVFGALLVIALYVAFKSYISHDLYVKELTEIGFDNITPGPDRALRVILAQSRRQLGSKIPPPYPNGWFALAESSEVKVGEVLAVDALGQNFCIYRGHDGKARIVDAYCPHLGANLGVGGSVCGNCIECPFHKWRFGADGVLVNVPGVDVVPKGIAIKTWTAAEADGAIWVWHDAEGRPPLWEQEEDPQFKGFHYRGRNVFSVSCHIQEIPENGADVPHLNAVHSNSVWISLGEKYPFLMNYIGVHIWNAMWTKGDGHISTVKMTHDYKVMKMLLFHLDIEVTQIGPGHVRLHLQSPFGPVLISQSVTPVGPLQQKVVHRIFTPTYNAPLGYILNRAESYQFERDVAIWNNKRFESAPAYVRSDKTIRSFRSWYSQFYSERSISFRDANNKTLDW